jgi:energy-converting hydrogenase Eha subunit E
MRLLIANIKWVMIVAGLITFGMIYAVVAPQAALRLTFGATLEEPLADVIVRNWGGYIALLGVTLIYGAYNQPARRFILTFASVSKLIFIGCVVGFGSQYLGKAGIAVVTDLVLVALFVTYLAGTRATR